jgi:hypothetical protein
MEQAKILNYQEAVYRIAQKSEGNKDGAGFLYAFLIGAGASVSSHIPDGKTMSESFQEKYKIHDCSIQENRQTHKGMTGYQSSLHLVREKTHDKFISQYIREMILSNARRPKPDYRWIINNCYNTLANILIECPYFSRTVFTTNFDPLLYYAFIQNWNTEPVLIRHYEELETMLPKEVYDEFPCLIYLHGYWQNHQLYLEPTQLETYADEWASRLTGWLQHDIIVIGYSGLEDSIALHWLNKCLDRGRTVWWCLYSPSGLRDMDSCHSIEKKLETRRGYLHFFPIRSADQFALDLGKKLGLTQAKDISCVSSIFSWFYPNSIRHFANGASLSYETNGDFVLKFKMGSDTFPGNNHAGINIDSVEHELDISQYKEIIIDYTLISKKLEKKISCFEFKLHSKKNAWSYHVPILSKGENSHKIPLAKFAENAVNLENIWRVVIAADVRCLGTDAEAEIAISKVRITR